LQASELKQIAEWLQAAGLSSIEVSGPNGSVRLTVANGENGSAPEGGPSDHAGFEHPSADQSITAVKAETVGIFLDTHPMRSTPIVQPGDRVKAGDIVGLIAIGRIYAPVTAPGDGCVVRFLVESGTLVDFGAPILEILTSEADATARSE
jgi:acetyl-CoA carboxylase biotin carboxyl carrier protein